MFRTKGMSEEDKAFEDRRDKIINAFKGGHLLEKIAFNKLKCMGLSDDQANEDLNG